MKICPKCNKKYFDDEGCYCLKCNYRLKHIEGTEINNRETILSQHKVENEDAYAKSVITCPYCQSTKTQKISALSKAGSVALFGVFALGKATKQWHCNNCGSDF